VRPVHGAVFKWNVLAGSWIGLVHVCECMLGARAGHGWCHLDVMLLCQRCHLCKSSACLHLTANTKCKALCVCPYNHSCGTVSVVPQAAGCVHPTAAVPPVRVYSGCKRLTLICPCRVAVPVGQVSSQHRGLDVRRFCGCPTRLSCGCSVSVPRALTCIGVSCRTAGGLRQ